jgi:hypothetical protein
MSELAHIHGNRIVKRTDDLYAAYRDGQLVAHATRKGKRCLWYVILKDQSTAATTRNPCPHARVSGQLPEDVQIRLVKAILEAS